MEKNEKPGGWLIKDFADGWYWTDRRIAAVAALTEGHLVYSVALGCYEDDGVETDPQGWTVNVGPDSITRRDEANARLIAAAPELLEALIETRALVSEAAQVGFDYRDGNWVELLFANQDLLSRTIAKATEAAS